MKVEEEREQEKFIYYIEDYYELSLAYQQKGIRELDHDFNNKKPKCKTNSDVTSFGITISEHSKGLASTMICTYSRNKQEIFYSGYQFTLHIPDQTRHPSGDIGYGTSEWYGINFQ